MIDNENFTKFYKMYKHLFNKYYSWFGFVWSFWTTYTHDIIKDRTKDIQVLLQALENKITRLRSSGTHFQLQSVHVIDRRSSIMTTDLIKTFLNSTILDLP